LPQLAVILLLASGPFLQAQGGGDKPQAAPQTMLPAAGATAGQGATGAAPAAPGSSPAAAGTAAPGASATAAGEDLLLETLPLDISTASFYELAEWAASLGLPTTGASPELRQRLYAHYGVEAPKTGPESTRVITIDRAQSAEYFKVDSSETSIIRISGGVSLTLKDEAKAENHSLVADEIVYDRERNALTARGHVHYRREKASNIDEFDGDTLSVDLEDWSGVFLDGRMRKANSGATASEDGSQASAEASAEAVARGFAFQAETILKRQGNLIVLDNGVISACDEPNPHYSIRAKRLWLLGDSEWAIADAVLSLGEVPVLWLPFFYYPSEEIVFHPVLGYRSREGRFVQTTTYLVGAKPAKKNTGLLSMIATDAGSEKQVRGFFLEPLPGSKAKEEGAASLKLLADVYSSLGAMVGVEGALPKAGPLSNLAFSLGLAVSRSILPVSFGSGYSPYAPANSYTSVWNGSTFLGSAIPLRYMGNLSGSLQFGPLTANLALPFFSDPFFEKDFRDRSEDMDWLKLSSTTDATATTISERTSFTQKAEIGLSLRPKATTPWLSSIDLSRLGASLSWLSKQNATLLKNSTSTSLFNVDPARNFFYPSILRPVDASLTLRGSLVKGARRGPEAGTKTARGLELEPPWELSEASSKTGAEAAPSPAFRLSARAPAYPTTSATATPGLSLDWSLNPSAFLENRYLDQAWKDPSLIDLSKQLYSLLSYRLASTMTSAYSLPGGAATVSLALNWTSQDQTRTSSDDAKAANPSLLASYALTDLQFKQSKLTSNFKLQAKPFPDSWLLSSSSISYALDANLYQRVYDAKAQSDDPYTTSTLDWNEKSITGNAASASLAFKTGVKTQTLGLTMNILPAQLSFVPSLGISIGTADYGLDLSSTTRAYKANTDSAVYAWDPLSASLTAKAPLGLKLTDNFALDLTTTPSRAKTNTVALSWGGFSTSLVSKLSKEYSHSASGWSATGLELFRVTDFSAAFRQEWKSEEAAPARASLSIDTSYTQSLLRFTESSLSFSLGVTLKIKDNIDLSFTSLSQNAAAWRYWPGLFPEASADKIGAKLATQVPMLADIAQSFYFWNDEARRNSLFKIKSLSVKLTHYLHDWDLAFAAQASPTLITVDGKKSYKIDPTFQLTLTWKDMTEMKAALNKTSTGLSY
jgi:lipopolysaccharide assembly outer membrane protein LptD (OstA)